MTRHRPVVPTTEMIRYRRAVVADRAAWAALRAALWPDCSRARHRLEVAQLLRSRGLVVVAEIADRLVGFAEVSLRRDHVEGTLSSPVPYLEGWYVRPAFRDRGVGRGLLVFAERWARSRGFRELASDAEIGNRRSIRLHRRLGFAEVGQTMHFVKGLEDRDA